MKAQLNFIRQQGFTDAAADSCPCLYPALMFQPRIVGVLIFIGILLQSGMYFLALGALLWWNALVPRLNPFDHLYNLVVARPKNLPPLETAPPPRRFSQGMAGTFMLTIAIALLAGLTALAWTVEVVLVAAFGALVAGRFCLGSYLYHLLRGQGDFANRTLPWSRAH